MKKYYSIFLSALALSFISTLARAEFYIGAEATDYVLKIKENDAPRVVTLYIANVGENSDTTDKITYNLDNIYKEDNFGKNLFIGYKFNDSYAVEVGAFSSNGKYKSMGYNPSEIGKIDIDSFNIDIIKSIKLKPDDALSFIGSLGVIYQKSAISITEFGYNGCVIIIGDESCSGQFISSKTHKNYYDTRAQIGLGATYEINDQFELRSTVKLIPNDLSISSSTPYTISLGALYYF